MPRPSKQPDPGIEIDPPIPDAIKVMQVKVWLLGISIHPASIAWRI